MTLAMTIAVVVGLMVLGLALLAVEIAVIPGVGLVGLLGVGSLVGAFAMAYQNLDAVWSVGTVGLSLVAAVALVRLLPRTRLARSMVLGHELVDQAHNPALALDELLGRAGVALTPLRPSGTADIGGRTVDVITDGQYVEAGTAVSVVDVRGSRVEVAATSDTNAAQRSCEEL